MILRTIEMKLLVIATSTSIAAATAFADCELLSSEDAEFVLGPNVTDLTGDDADFQCVFLGGAPQATFIIQFADRGYYDQASILKPHTPVDVGEEGRANVDTNGITALQFVQDDNTVTMSVRPPPSPDREYLDALVTVGKRLAERLN